MEMKKNEKYKREIIKTYKNKIQIKEMKIFPGEVNNKLDTADEMKCSIIFELYW